MLMLNLLSKNQLFRFKDDFFHRGSVLDVTAEPKTSFLHTLECVCWCFWICGLLLDGRFETKTLAF